MNKQQNKKKEEDGHGALGPSIIVPWLLFLEYYKD